jgi:hypothetical protein
MSTYAGVVKEIPILPFPAADYLVRGNVVEWNTSQQLVSAWVDETVAPFGIATGDSDTDLGEICVYVGKGCSVQILCDVGIVPAAGDYLYWSGEQHRDRLSTIRQGGWSRHERHGRGGFTLK